jgi:hypothetical protein
MSMGTMFAKLAVSVAVAFLCAYPFAELSGTMARMEDAESRSVLVTASGVILFFLTLSLIGPAIRVVHKIQDTLKQAETRPGPTVAVTMLCLGAICAISALFVQYSAGRNATGVSMNVAEFGRKPQLVMQTSGSFVLGLLTVLTFLLGASLVALGTWASLKPPAKATSPLVKTEVADLREQTI